MTDNIIQWAPVAATVRDALTRKARLATQPRGVAGSASGSTARSRSSVAAAVASGSRKRTTPRPLHAMPHAPIGESNTANEAPFCRAAMRRCYHRGATEGSL